MHEFATNDFLKCADLFRRGQPNEAVCFSVIELRNPGRILVDRASKPESVFVASDFGWGFFGGRITERFVSSCLEMFPRQLINIPNDGSEFTLPKAYQLVIERLEFRNIEFRQKGTVTLPEGFAAENIDEAVLDRCQWKNVVIAGSGTAENFFKHGLGVVLTYQGQLVSESYALFKTLNLVEIGSITAEPFRGRGLSTLTTSLLIERCHAQGDETTWTCDRDNLASRAIAKKMGYKNCTPYRFVGRQITAR